MANIQNLKEKAQKAQEKVEKCKATIARHEKQLAKKIALLEEKSGRTVDTENLDAYKWDENNKSYDYYWEACDVSGKLEDIKGAKKKLAEAEKILSNWKEKIEVEINKEKFVSENAPQVIIDFLQDWKEKAYDWHIKRHEDFQQFKANLDAEVANAYQELGIRKGMFPSRSEEAKLKEMGLDYKTVNAKKANFAGGAILMMDGYRNEKERLEWLENTLERERKAKLLDLITRIRDVVGEITDASNLAIRAGNINGFITGTEGKAEVETIGAGGYNIQCFHYRTLIKKI